MAPPKSSRNHDDTRPDAATGGAKEKAATSTKMRRGASQTSAQHREPPVAPTSAPSQAVNEAVAPTLQWSTFDREVLHAYCREHRLNTPTSFASSFHQCVLSQPGGIGIHSPTMARKRNARRQSKDRLALAVRKHSNSLGVQENDVIVDFIFKLRTQTNAKKNTAAPVRNAGEAEQ